MTLPDPVPDREPWPSDMPLPHAAPPGDPPPSPRDDGAPEYPRDHGVRRNRHEPAECQPEGATCQPAVIARPWRAVYMPPEAPPGESLEVLLERGRAAPRPVTKVLPYTYTGRPRVLFTPPSEPVSAGAWMAEVEKRGR